MSETQPSPLVTPTATATDLASATAPATTHGSVIAHAVSEVEAAYAADLRMIGLAACGVLALVVIGMIIAVVVG